VVKSEVCRTPYPYPPVIPSFTLFLTRLLIDIHYQGKQNDLIERIRNTEYFKPIWGDLDTMMEPKLYIGRSDQIVAKYCGAGGPVEKALAPYQQYITTTAAAQLNV
jgi:adenylosuccinate lyase